LQSRFPTKTVLFLLGLGGAAYYFVDWEHDITHELNPAALHFHKTPEDCKMAMAIRPQPLMNHDEVNEYLDMCIATMDEEDSKKYNIPVTHAFHLPSNSPTEDFLSIGTSPGINQEPWNYWGVYDGHAGPWTSSILQQQLIPLVSLYLNVLKDFDEPLTSAVINHTIGRAFTDLDDQIMGAAKQALSWSGALTAKGIGLLAPALSGSCAVLAIFDPKSSLLRVACTGDSRAVLGRWDPVEEKYTTMPLSVDQTGFNESEVERITKEHPDEEGLIDPKTGRTLGMAITRAFGDHRWKWPEELIREAQYKFWGYRPRPNAKTPPYLTALPVIEEVEIRRGDNPVVDGGKADFLIMASDGLWDHISSEHAVELVQRWLEAKARGNGLVTRDPQLLEQDSNWATQRYSPDSGAEYDVEEGAYPTWKVEPKYFAIEDDNAAQCLARNAFGGTRSDLLSGVLSYSPPLSRDVRDDTTILVVFFDRVPEPGKKKKKKESIINLRIVG
jgi:pyruvate dehydrogenase phosphatase